MSQPQSGRPNYEGRRHVFKAYPTTGAATQFCNLIPGVAGWQCTSDRNAKENFRPADGREILRRLVAMPLFSWNLKGADPSVRSLGPTAQDFYAAFGLDNDDKTIASTNLDGVALAAIQGLHQMMREKDREIAQLRRKLRATEVRLGSNQWSDTGYPIRLRFHVGEREIRA